jgi:hypothetical protein
MSVHEKQKHFKCWICEKEFGEKSKLKQQIIAVHKKLKAYKCLICEVEFGQKIGLKKHMSVVHENKSNHNLPRQKLSQGPF